MCREINIAHYTKYSLGSHRAKQRSHCFVSQMFQILFPLNDVTNVMVTILHKASFLPLATDTIDHLSS